MNGSMGPFEKINLGSKPCGLFGEALDAIISQMYQSPNALCNPVNLRI